MADIDQRTLSLYELELQEPKLEAVVKLVEALDCDANELLGVKTGRHSPGHA